VGNHARDHFFNCSVFMASHKFSSKFGYQQRESSGLPVYHPGYDMQLPFFKRVIKMAQIKWTLIICDILGIPATFLGIVSNIDNIRSIILFILALTYIMFRLYYYAIQKQQAVREKEIDLWHKEQDKQERINKTKK
jgi:hypothetical protein